MGEVRIKLEEKNVRQLIDDAKYKVDELMNNLAILNPLAKEWVNQYHKILKEMAEAMDDDNESC